MVVLILPTVENQVKTKHVESILVPRLDESSNLSISTKATDYQWLLFLRHYFGDLVVVC